MDRWLCTVMRALLLLLGLLMAWSALRHWTSGDELRDHYAASRLGVGGTVIVAGLQSIAALALLTPRLQRTGAWVLGAVMLVIAGMHLVAPGTAARAALPLALATWAWGPAVVLQVLDRRRRPPGETR